jgi:hypothetical protein
MYRALKTAQNEINASLLRMADDFAQLSESKGEPELRNNANQNCNLNGVNAQIQELSNTMAYLHQKQNGQFSTMLQEIQSLNTNMMNILQLLVEQKKSIDTVTTIPCLQHTAQASELKDVYVTPVPEMNHVGQLDTNISEIHDLDKDSVPEDDHEDSVPEDSVPEDDDIPDIEEEEAPDVEVPESPQEEVEEEGLEVEEWTFKGRSFFKDSDNTVYANNAGEIGDPIGQYDPVKNIMKKLPTN